MKLRLLLGALVLTGACKHDKADPAAATMGSAAAEAVVTEPAGTVTTIKGFATPESGLYDPAGDRYLVSNINGDDTPADDNGFVATVSPAGEVRKWIDGAAADIKLDSPKGMAISGDVLWVADVTVVRRFDISSGKQQADIPVDGAVGLNDVVADGAGGIYVTDLDGDAVYRIGKDGTIKTIAKGAELGNPNGIAIGSNGSVWIATFGTGELYEIDAKGVKQPASKPPKGGLDGLILLDGGEAMVSSWDGKAIYKGQGTTWKAIVTGVDTPADIGFDSKRRRLLIPVSSHDTLVLHTL